MTTYLGNEFKCLCLLGSACPLDRLRTIGKLKASRATIYFAPEVRCMCMFGSHVATVSEIDMLSRLISLQILNVIYVREL